MPSSTAVNNYPYPVLGDPPNIPADIKALADRAETITNTQAALISGKASSSRLIAQSALQTGSSSFIGTEIIIWQLQGTSLGASEKYRVELQGDFFTGSSTQGNGTISFRWRTGAVTILNTDAAFGSQSYTIPPNITLVPCKMDFILTGVPAGAFTIGIGGKTSNGISCSMDGTSTNWRQLRIWDEGI
jgi:hypothetical protein